MEFLQGNWFSILTVAVIAAGWFITRGRREGKMDEVITKVDGLDKKFDKASEAFDAHEKRFNDHIGDSNMHITPTLLDLFKERHEYAKKEFADTRNDIQRVESLLTDMMRPR